MSQKNIINQKLKKARKKATQSPYEKFGDNVQYYPPDARLQIKEYLGSSSVKIEDYSHSL